jgi:hypothetical protein
MRPPTLLASLSIAGLLLLGLPGCPACTDLGCSSNIAVSIEVPGGLGALEGATTRVCRDDDCIDSDIVMDAAMADCEAVPHENFYVLCHVTAEGVVQFTIDVSDQGAENGEDFRLAVIAADGSELASKSGTVLYQRWEYNGEGCGYCFTGTFVEE